MKYLILLSMILANFVRDRAPVVKVKGGLLRGLVSEDGGIYQYFGIPYGVVNRGNRFQAPLPPPKWSGIYDAINENVRCPQKMIGSFIMGDEDCLKLHVYTPARVIEEPLPVMAFIHGGCFLEGTGTSFLYGPEYIVQEDVIFVGVNYRLNVEGFLCLGIREAPGNAGLKDQVAALRWVRDNIAAFGGNPNNVTLFGESAGAVSISYLILSPAASGLFHRAIMQSGATIAPWGLQHDPIKTASELAMEFGYFGHDPYEIYKVLSDKSVHDIIFAIKHTKYRQFTTAQPLFAPCVENHISGIESIVTQYPMDIIKSGNYTKLPIIIGYNNKEGIYFAGKTHGNSIKKVESEVEPRYLFQNDLQFPTKETENATMSTIMSRYFSRNQDDIIMNLVDLYSDLHIKYPIAVESNLYTMTSNQPIFFYLFKYDGYINMPKIISGYIFKPGASHADELMYLFKPRSFPLPTRYCEIKMIKRMVSLWTNFAKYSDPTPTTNSLIPIKWRPSRSSNPLALVIDRRLTTAPMWDTATIQFWNSTYIKYRRKDYGKDYFFGFTNGSCGRGRF